MCLISCVAVLSLAALNLTDIEPVYVYCQLQMMADGRAEKY